MQERLPGCQSISDAKKALALRQGEVFSDEHKRPVDDVTLGEFLPIFEEAKAGLRTLPKYLQQIRDQFGFLLGQPLAAIDRSDVLSWYARRLQRAAVSTANNEIAALRAVLGEAKHRQRIRENVLVGLRLRTPNNFRRRVLNAEEARALLKAAAKRKDHTRPLCFLLFSTGCRLSEILRLTWDDIDFVSNWITIVDAKSLERRRVPLAGEARAHVLWWKRSPHSGKRFVFQSPSKDQPMVQVGKSWRSLCRDAGIFGLRRHDMRHNFISHLQMIGVSDAVISGVTGHKTLASLKRYSHALDEAKEAAVQKLMSSHRAVTAKRHK